MTIELPLKNISPEGESGSDLRMSTSAAHEASSDSSWTENSRSKKEPSPSESEREEERVGECAVVEMVVLVEGEDATAEVVVVETVEPLPRQYLRRLKFSIDGRARERERKRGEELYCSASFVLFGIAFAISLALLRWDEIRKGGYKGLEQGEKRECALSVRTTEAESGRRH
jgi:hypothetical protein